MSRQPCSEPLRSACPPESGRDKCIPRGWCHGRSVVRPSYSIEFPRWVQKDHVQITFETALFKARNQVTVEVKAAKLTALATMPRRTPRT